MIRRLLQLLALGLMTIVVCASSTSPAEIARVNQAIEVAASSGRAPEPAHSWCDVVERDGEEAFLNDEIDDDTCSHIADDTAIRDVRFPHRPPRTLRDEPQIDTSRFAMGTGLPRGPPT